MDEADYDLRLSRIETMWSMVEQAKNPDDQVRAAQAHLLELYNGAIRRYLLGATRDPEVAEELGQEFAIRFLRGRLRGASPKRGRFRDYVKGVLIHLVANYRGAKKLVQLAPDRPEPAARSLADHEQAFLEGWRDELLAKSWAALEAKEQEGGQPLYTVLRFRAENPKASSQEMATRLQEMLGRPLNATSLRQMLHRARDRFADILLAEIARGLHNPSLADLEEELIDLGLLKYCQPALQRRIAES
jgi:RNA polymerase sigma-70 factor (ECF subfamily)